MISVIIWVSQTHFNSSASLKPELLAYSKVSHRTQYSEWYARLDRELCLHP